MTQSEAPQEATPTRVITPNQLVAYNVAFYRNALGMTQEELAGHLTSHTHEAWSKATVSAAERSFYEGARVRQFDANDLMALSSALGVPLLGFFLPPTEDGESEEFRIAGSPSTPGGVTTKRLVEILFRNPTQHAKRGVDSYLERVRQAFDRYFGDDAGSGLPANIVQQELEESLVKVEEHAREALNAADRVRRWVRESQGKSGERS